MPTPRPGPPGPAPRWHRDLSARSRPALEVLARQPRLLVAAVVLGVALLGLVGPPVVGAVALLAVAAVLAWLGALSWPGLPDAARAVRVVTVVLVVAAAVTRLASG